VNKLVLILIAIFLPPVAVVLKRGFGKDLLINILLCLLVSSRGWFMPCGSYQSRCALKNEDEVVSQRPCAPFESRALQPGSPDDDRISHGGSGRSRVANSPASAD